MKTDTHSLLTELKTVFANYAPLWDAWQNYQFNGLSKEDVYVLTVQKQQKYSYSPGDSLMFYNKDKAIESVLEKLKVNYPHYQEWVVMKFWFSLIRRLDKHLLDHYFGLSFDDLPLSLEEKNILKQFGVSSINQLFQTYTDEDLKQQSSLYNLVVGILSLQQKKVSKLR